MKMREPIAADFVNCVLQDDKTCIGGTSNSNETLGEFLEELDVPLNTSMNEVNKKLEECHIMPITY